MVLYNATTKQLQQRREDLVVAQVRIGDEQAVLVWGRGFTFKEAEGCWAATGKYERFNWGDPWTEFPE